METIFSVNFPHTILIGLSCRTSNANEMDPQSAQIPKIIQQYWESNLADKIPNRAKPGITYATYSHYDSDENGEYQYFYGEAVTHLDILPEGFDTLIIPGQQNYTKFTTPKGPLPNIVIDAWQAIWKMTATDFGGNRAYSVDFEIYDERASDPTDAAIDLYIAVDKE